MAQLKEIEPKEIEPPPDSLRKIGDKMIGSGASSRVYLGTWQGAEIAVKAFKSGLEKPQDMANFRKEARFLASLTHPNIVPIYGAVCHPDCPAILMRYCSRGSLSNLLQDLTIKQRLSAIKSVAGGVAFVHSYSVAHRDLKPANVYVDQSGEVLIGDFGLAKSMEEGTGHTKSTMVGTVQYMSPEAMSSNCAGSQWLKSDMWSFGMTAYEILTGEAPFPGLVEHEIIEEVKTRGAIPDLSKLPKETPSYLVELIKKCLSPNPQSRPTADQVFEALKNIPRALLVPESPSKSSVASSSSASASADSKEKEALEARLRQLEIEKQSHVEKAKQAQAQAQAQAEERLRREYEKKMQELEKQLAAEKNKLQPQPSPLKPVSNHSLLY